MITPEQLAKSGSEHGHQAAVFAWSAMNVGKYPELKYLFAIPNGFFGSAGQKGKMKAEGLRSGVPDIFLPVTRFTDFNPLTKYHGLFIEMKIEKHRATKDGGCTEEQSDFISFLRYQGYQCEVCYGWEEARNVLIQYLELGK